MGKFATLHRSSFRAVVVVYSVIEGKRGWGWVEQYPRLTDNCAMIIEMHQGALAKRAR